MPLFRLTKQIPAQEKIAELENRIQELEKRVRSQERMITTLAYGRIDPIKLEFSSHWQRGWKLIDAAWKEFDEHMKGMFR